MFFSVPSSKTLGLLTAGGAAGGGTGYGITQSNASSHEDYKITQLKVEHALKEEGLKEQHTGEITALKQQHAAEIAKKNVVITHLDSHMKGVDKMIDFLSQTERSNNWCGSYWSTDWGKEDITPKVFRLWNTQQGKAYDKTYYRRTTGCKKLP